MRIIFWGSSDFSLPSLQALFEHHTIAAVVTQPDKPYGRGLKQIHQTPMKEFAVKHDIPVFQPYSLKKVDILPDLAKLDPDLSVIVSYGKILPDSYITLPRYESINLHASLLPAYRGASPIQWALLQGEKQTGNTVQFITSELDAGDIIGAEKLNIYELDDFFSLSERLARSGADLLLRCVTEIANKTALRVHQDHNQATYSRIIHKNDGQVDFSTETAQEIWNKYRAFISWPGLNGIYHDLDHSHELPVSFTKIMRDDTISGVPGTIIQADKLGLKIACRQGGIQILEIKPAGKKEMDYKAFMNGHKPRVGQHF